MGAGTSPADPSAEADGTPAASSRADEPGMGGKAADAAAPDRTANRDGDARGAGAGDGGDREGDVRDAGDGDGDAHEGDVRDADDGDAHEGDVREGEGDGGTGAAPRPSRRFPSLTRDTARPEGGGRAASGDAPAPARQWPLLAVLCTAGIGLLIVAVDPFAEAFRVGTMLIGAALIGGAVLRLVVPSVGMLAVRSRFTDLVTYGLLGFLIVMLALVAQPKPWLDIPFLEQAVHFTIR
ncbi:DUF3017 domain-containing protein [Streptomyces sp. NBC_00264]|uniref:DUF3017 domain-containing protein n=1 Tax=unclassified Streptomyces TaxID=2593676 RepID=UPI00224EDB82|nr:MULTISPECIES: DUF3017 domain-containing protein [unclassified Streptomyces]MCX4394509.1 DUF3017 domain-containing protein [Streptomyces sp. NBC_01767]MCX5162417.1 DUF3017 domain-containing protein [Streptomyces sp. NBC_00305]MCX5220934.1 DUF3017 domain-containing protein [Streptomyces sp. NBC_00264]WSP47097.1 DUF3017 domain-containing protein [Streptomyces sp. NBC_01243]